MKSPKEIFKSHPSPSQEEISSYLEGKLSAAEQNRIEQKIAHDEFNSDAFEGIEQNPSGRPCAGRPCRRPNHPEPFRTA